MPEETLPEMPQQPVETSAAKVAVEASESPEKPILKSVEVPVQPVEALQKPLETPVQPVEALQKPLETPVHLDSPVEKSNPIPKTPPATADAAETAPARAKPAVVEAKPLADYLKEDLQPLLLKRLQTEGAADMQITTREAELTATWDAGDKTFTLYFDDGNLDGRKTIASSQAKSRGKNIQMFMPPERGFKGVDAKTITAMIVTQFTTTLTWIKKPSAKVGKKK